MPIYWAVWWGKQIFITTHVLYLCDEYAKFSDGSFFTIKAVKRNPHRHPLYLYLIHIQYKLLWCLMWYDHMLSSIMHARLWVIASNTPIFKHEITPKYINVHSERSCFSSRDTSLIWSVNTYQQLPLCPSGDRLPAAVDWSHSLGVSLRRAARTNQRHEAGGSGIWTPLLAELYRQRPTIFSLSLEFQAAERYSLISQFQPTL